MKKLIVSIAAFAAMFSLHADFKKPTRTVEIGVDAEAGMSNSYLGIKDIFKENLVIDLNEIAEAMNGNGLTFDLFAKSSFYINVQGEHKRFSFFTNVESSGYANLPQEFFDLLAEGFKTGTNKTMTLQAYGDMFLETGISYYRKWDKFAFSVAPSYVVPVFYMEDIQADVSYKVLENGYIGVNADAPVAIYSAFDLKPFIDNEGEKDEALRNIGQIMKNGGIDLSLSVEKKILRTLDATLYTRIPVIPGKLTHKASARYWAYAYENNLLGILDDTEDRDYDWGHDDFTYSSASLNVFRPFRLGVEGLWRPFGNWSYFKFGIGMAARNPYSGNAIIYPEGELSADFRILNILGFNFGAFYKNRVWTQKVGLTLNCHILEIDAFAGFRCADLSRSFNATGAAAGVSVKMGW